jgi:carboxylesterase type B
VFNNVATMHIFFFLPVNLLIQYYLFSVSTICTGVVGDTPKVTLHSGVYEGISTKLPESSSTVYKYLGIPFAVPPLGALRFRPPQPLRASGEAFKADSQPPACIQNGGNSKLIEVEDCLKLNIFAPARHASRNESNGGLTVMVWLFGGGLQSGTAGVPLYDGTSIAANQGVILVAPNYRTNVR